MRIWTFLMTGLAIFGGQEQPRPAWSGFGLPVGLGVWSGIAPGRLNSGISRALSGSGFRDRAEGTISVSACRKRVDPWASLGMTDFFLRQTQCLASVCRAVGWLRRVSPLPVIASAVGRAWHECAEKGTLNGIHGKSYLPGQSGERFTFSRNWGMIEKTKLEVLLWKNPKGNTTKNGPRCW